MREIEPPRWIRQSFFGNGLERRLWFGRKRPPR
jgi:hypothetical protein